MPGGVLPYQDSYIDIELLSYMKSFDLRIGTLECAIGTNLKPAKEKLRKNGGNDNICFARDEDFFRIKELGFNVMSIGNNHSFDLGEEGLRNTIRVLRENGIGFCGAGMNLDEASQPYVSYCSGLSVCIIGCCIKGLSPKSLIVATENSYGVYQPTIEELATKIYTLKTLYDYVIVMPHWGEEHVRIPPFENVKYARQMIDAGADAIFGSHSHCLAPYTFYKSKPVFYGMGNFLYPDFCMMPPRPFYYPSTKQEIDEMQRCINYPSSVKSKTLCIWGKDSRYGLAVEAVIGKGIHSSYRIVRIDKNNILHLLNYYSKVEDLYLRHIRMPLASKITQWRLYGRLYKLVFRYERRIRNVGDFRKNK